MPLVFDLRSFNKKTTRVLKRVDDEVAIPALKKTATKMIADAKKDTPVDTGKLKDSLGYEIKNSGLPTAIMGSEVPYALIVHEDLDALHPVGGAKFLQNAIRKNIRTLEKNVRDKMRRI